MSFLSKLRVSGGRDIFIPKRRALADKIGCDASGRAAYQPWADLHRVDPFSEGATIFDNQVVILQYSGSVRATFHTNCHAGIPERRFYLCGTEGSIRADANTGRIEVGRIGWGMELETIEIEIGGTHSGGDLVMGRGLVKTI